MVWSSSSSQLIQWSNHRLWFIFCCASTMTLHLGIASFITLRIIRIWETNRLWEWIDYFIHNCYLPWNINPDGRAIILSINATCHAGRIQWSKLQVSILFSYVLLYVWNGNATKFNNNSYRLKMRQYNRNSDLLSFPMLSNLMMIKNWNSLIFDLVFNDNTFYW